MQQPSERNLGPEGVDPVQSDLPADDSGSAGSFDSRHGEFADEGHAGAGRDPRTHEEVHGDGVAGDDADGAASGFDAEQPEGVSQELQEEALRAHEQGAKRHEHVSEELSGEPER